MPPATLDGHWSGEASFRSRSRTTPRRSANASNRSSLRASRKKSQSQPRLQGLIEELGQHERKEQEMRRYVTYLALGQQLTRTGSWSWNRYSGEIFWSREHFRIFGLDPSRANVSCHLFLRMVHPKERAQVKDEFESAVRAGRDFDYEYRIIRPDRCVAHIHSRGRPVFGKRGDLAQYVGTVVDVSERRYGEDWLGSMQAELARASRAVTLGQLVASIAHEVNQPLAALVANASASLRWLDWKEPRIDKARQALARIIRDGNRASEIIARTRTLVRKADAQRSPLNLSSTVREVSAFLRPELRRHNITLRTNLAENLPLVNADRLQMQQVLLNLLMNAIDALCSVSPRRRVLTVVTRSDAADVAVSVRDRGVGLDGRMLERIFEPFYSTKPQGMGIGLSISRSIIEAHGGTLGAMPNKGWGATFQFRVPAAGLAAI